MGCGAGTIAGASASTSNFVGAGGNTGARPRASVVTPASTPAGPGVNSCASIGAAPDDSACVTQATRQ